MTDTIPRYDSKELEEAIKDSLNHYKEKNAYVAIRFHFAPTTIYKRTREDLNVKHMCALFKRLGFTPHIYDTVMESFNLNQDFFVITCDKCIRDYGYALPVTDDIATLVEITEMVYDGKVAMLVEEIDPDEVERIMKDEKNYGW